MSVRECRAKPAGRSDAIRGKGRGKGGKGNSTAELLCRDYQKGKCHRGDRCRYSHAQASGHKAKKAKRQEAASASSDAIRTEFKSMLLKLLKK